MRRRSLFALVLLIAFAGCRRVRQADTTPFSAPEIGLSLPHPEGWVRDPSVHLDDPGKGGPVMRLNREEQVAGMPRIDVSIDPVPVRPIFLEDVLSRALRDMASLEERGTIDITALERKPIRVGPRRGFRVSHQYVMHNADEQIGITQTSALFVLDGRGITVTAAGRTELYTPLAEEIDQIISGMTVALTGPSTVSGALGKPTDLAPRENAPRTP